MYSPLQKNVAIFTLLFIFLKKNPEYNCKFVKPNSYILYDKEDRL